MKYIKKYEKYDDRKKVYWIIPFNDKFEDSIVKIMMQYSNIGEYTNKIEIVDNALGIANDAKENLEKDNFAIFHLQFKYENDELVYGPEFGVFPISDKDIIEKEGYIFVGFYNTTKAEYVALNQYNL